MEELDLLKNIVMENIMLELISTSSSSSSSSSSSDSSDSSDSLFDLMCSGDEDIFNLIINPSHREKKLRVDNFVDDVVKNYSDDEFRHHFRLSRSVAYKLIDMYEQSTYYKSRLYGGRKGVTAETQCLSFLWFAANKSTFREVSNLFQVSEAASHMHLTNILDFIFEISPQIINFPDSEKEKAQKSREFQQLAGFPDILGCIDTSYIYIRKPEDNIRSTYVNRHGLISITVQGICGANKKFMDASVGVPSKTDDSRVFNLSIISKDLPEICGGKYHLLGDAAYPLREYLLTPFIDYGNLIKKKIIYNEKHCQSRVKIENAFDLLKHRFQQLVQLDFFTVSRMCKFVLACCVLHNLCIDNGDAWDDTELVANVITEGERLTTSTSQENAETMSEAILTHLGELKRLRIMNNF